MSLFDFDAPNMSKIELDSVGLNTKDIFYVAFLFQGELHARPVQLLNKAFNVYNSNFSEIIRVETAWKYIFKEKTLTGYREREIVFGNGDDPYGFDTLRIDFIGRSPDEAKIRFVKYNLGAPYLEDYEKVLLTSELEHFSVIKPSMVKLVDTIKMYNGTGNLLNLDKYFVNVSEDILNVNFFKKVA